MPGGLRAYVVAVVAAAVLVVAATAWTTPAPAWSWGWLGVLAAASALHLEASQGIERTRVVAVEGRPYAHLQSIWFFAGVLLLPLPALALLIGSGFAHEWFRVFRGKVPPHRKVFSAATVVLGSWTAQLAITALHPGGSGLARLDGPGGAAALLTAGLLYWLVNYALVVGAIILSHPEQPARKALGSPSDQLAIAAACGMGWLMALAMHHQPWAAPIGLVTILALHLGLLYPQYRRAAQTDPLTELVNTRWWHDRARDHLRRALAEHTPLAVLLIDLDHFKEVNDTHGHLVGDTVLRAVADTLRRTVRGTDLVGRVGGEEFAVLLPDTTLTAAAATAERVRTAVAALAVPLDQGAEAVTGLTVSIGAGAAPDNGTTLDQLRQTTDLALYEAKEAGRNAVRLASAVVEPIVETPR
ncbi:diguanylate cyclase [Saccharothrix syringae]|uniref:Diguanylate cyclase n=1 Tax=Saccharothrix syringae TaxID=103733 RepID=A0A5Q0HDI0_SACSY|nr:diguanylate cyclase [Saccharothrix syringae]